MKLQQISSKEQFIDVRVNLSISGNIKPFVGTQLNIHKKHVDFRNLISRIYLKKFGLNRSLEYREKDLAVVSSSAQLEFIDKNKALENYNPQFTSLYKQGVDVHPVVFVHPNLFNLGIDDLYSVDGMHRILSALVAGEKEIPCYTVIRRTDIPIFLSDEQLTKIKNCAVSTKWFPRYQTIRECKIVGQREQEKRYSKVYNFDFILGKSVVDFGGNIGQALLEAYFNGATKMINFECQPEAVQTGNLISDTLGLNIEHICGDFNNENFESLVLSRVNNWDWALFTAIWLTKEIKDAKSLFSFIYNHTNIGIVFESHGNPVKNSDERIKNWLSPFKFESMTYLGKHQNRKGFLLKK